LWLLFPGYHAAPTGGQLHTALQEAADKVTSALEVLQGIAKVFSMDDTVREKV
jgi:hypothetical protein